MSTGVARKGGAPDTAVMAGPEKTRPRGRLSLVAWVLFALALSAAILFAGLWQSAKASERRRAEVASNASRFLTALTNFQGRTIEADVAEIRAFAVGEFAKQVDTFFGQQAVEALRSAGAQSIGRVHSIFVESLSGDSATVFGVVDESVTNAANPAPRTEVLRVEIEMIHTTDGWKVESVNILQSPDQSLPFGSGS
jgi:Mce-associated membrane protein